MRAKSHDQRKGQWLINKIRESPEFQKRMQQLMEDLDNIEDINNIEKTMIEKRLWNMENDVFDKLMEDYDK